MTTAPEDPDALRAQVVLLVVRAIVTLTFLLYVFAGVLVLRHTDVPDWLVAGASAAFGSLVTLLLNSKGRETTPQPVTVENPAEDPVPVEAPRPRAARRTRRMPAADEAGD